jgi:hypothetical protein
MVSCYNDLRSRGRTSETEQQHWGSLDSNSEQWLQAQDQMPTFRHLPHEDCPKYHILNCTLVKRHCMLLSYVLGVVSDTHTQHCSLLMLHTMPINNLYNIVMHLVSSFLLCYTNVRSYCYDVIFNIMRYDWQEQTEPFFYARQSINKVFKYDNVQHCLLYVQHCIINSHHQNRKLSNNIIFNIVRIDWQEAAC